MPPAGSLVVSHSPPHRVRFPEGGGCPGVRPARSVTSFQRSPSAVAKRADSSEAPGPPALQPCLRASRSPQSFPLTPAFPPLTSRARAQSRSRPGADAADRPCAGRARAPPALPSTRAPQQGGGGTQAERACGVSKGRALASSLGSVSTEC